MWFMVCTSPLCYLSDGAMCHLWRFAAQQPWPVWKRFHIDQVDRWRLKPGGRTVGSQTRCLLTTDDDCQSDLHLAMTSTGIMSNQIGFLDDRRGAVWLKTSSCTDQSGSSSTLWSSLSQAALRRRWGGGMLARTGSQGSCVVRRVPEISRMEAFSCASTALV